MLFKDVEKTKNRINNNISGAVGCVCDWVCVCDWLSVRECVWDWVCVSVSASDSPVDVLLEITPQSETVTKHKEMSPGSEDAHKGVVEKRKWEKMKLHKQAQELKQNKEAS